MGARMGVGSTERRARAGIAASREMASTLEQIHSDERSYTLPSGMLHLIEYRTGSIPFVRRPPITVLIKLSDNPVNKVLFLPRLRQADAVLFADSLYYLFQPIDCMRFDTMAQRLRGKGGQGQPKAFLDAKKEG